MISNKKGIDKMINNCTKLNCCFDLSEALNIRLIGQTICCNDWELLPRMISEYEIVIPFQGEIEITLDEDKYIVHQGECVLFVPNELHSGVLTVQANVSPLPRFYYAHFDSGKPVFHLTDEQTKQELNTFKEIENTDRQCKYFVLSESRFEKVFIPRVVSLGKYAGEIYTIFEKALNERNNLTIGSAMMISFYLSQILVKISRIVISNMNIKLHFDEQGKIPQAVQEAIFLIHENYHKPLEIKDICHKLEISPQYLIRLFNKSLGITPLQYLNRHRIDKAKELLRNSSMTMQEICFGIGLENPFYFSRLFKRLEGIAPSNIKKSASTRSNS